MKNCTIFLLMALLPFAAFSQGLKTNHFDKFLKKQRIEMVPLPLAGLTGKNKLSVSLSAIESMLYLHLEGTGWGAATVDKGNELILLFSNDSTVTLKATRLQSFEPGLVQNTYRHEYHIRPADLKALSEYELTGIRKYSFTVFSDLAISKANAEKVRQQSAAFLLELKKANVLKTLKQIQLKDIGNYIGDSVQFCSKVFKTRYFEGSADGPTLLDVQADFSDPFVNVVIYERDRHKFNNAPEKRYLNKEVCISGVVGIRDNIPYVIVRDREQIRLKSSITLEEVALFEGDSVTVSGKVFTARYLEESKTKPTLLNVGAPFPDQPLTLVIEQADRGNFLKPEVDFLHKTLKVSGRIVSFRNKPQIVLHTMEQVEVLPGTDPGPTFVSVQTNAAKAATQAVSREADPEKLTPPVANETAAEFTGGTQAFDRFLRENLIYPAALESKEQKRVVASFQIDTAGHCSDIKIVESAGSAFDEEVIRVLLKMPKWKPATRNGQVTATVMTHSVTFRGKEMENRQ